MDERQKTLKYLADAGIDVSCEQKRSKILYFSAAGLMDEEICRVLQVREDEAIEVLKCVRRRLLQNVHEAQSQLRKLDCCISCIKKGEKA